MASARRSELTERLAREGQLTPSQVAGIERVLNATWTDPRVGASGRSSSLTGSWAAFFSALFAAIALFLAKKAPWPPLPLLVVYGWELQVSHTMPPRTDRVRPARHRGDLDLVGCRAPTRLVRPGGGLHPAFVRIGKEDF